MDTEGAIQKENSVVIAEVDPEAAKKLFRMVFAGENCLVELFPNPILANLEDVKLLNGKIDEKLSRHDTSKLSFKAIVSFENGRSHELRSWERFIAGDWSAPDALNSLSLTWSFMLIPPAGVRPSMHSLNVRIASSVSPHHLMQALFSKDPEELDHADMLMSTMSVRIDYVDYVLGQELLDIVSRWNKGLRSPSLAMPGIRWAKRHSELIASLVRRSIPVFASTASFSVFFRMSREMTGAAFVTVQVFRDVTTWAVASVAGVYAAWMIGKMLASYNQALNPLFSYAVRSFYFAKTYLLEDVSESPIAGTATVSALPASAFREPVDIFVTDPPYGDAVKYEEILEFFIAWLRKNPPPEFANWIWDSRRALAIKGEDEDFRRGMVAAYKQMAECMPDNGIQVVMFTHQSGAIWADMANIVWAAGMHVTAAWYVVTETDSALREGSYVKGTVLLVLRKSHGRHKTTRDDLAWEIQEEVEKQVDDLTGLNQQAKGLYRDENVFEDADIQMAGYAAALRVLTRYAVIDGRDMTAEAIRPRVKGETTFVDGLIAFAVDTANRCLVPQGVTKGRWEKLSGAERFYLKMLDMESRGSKTLDNYQNFAKAFKVRDFKPLLESHKANDARLKSAVEFGRAEMGEGSELHQSTLRAVLYGLMELQKEVDGAEVLAHLTLNVPNYYSDMTQREMVVELADYLETRLDALRPGEASAARVLRELVKNQRLG